MNQSIYIKYISLKMNRITIDNVEDFDKIVSAGIGKEGIHISSASDFEETITEEEMKEMEECAQKIMENMPIDENGIPFLELKEKVGVDIFYGGLGLCMNKKWILKKGLNLVNNNN
jgi:hypothetical protein